MSDSPLVVRDDGLYTPDIKLHSIEKIRLHNRYARIFATSMRSKWPQLAYVGLYSGGGHARISGTDEIVETSALSVLRQPDRFTDYIYVDYDQRCVEALRTRSEPLRAGARLSVIEADVNESVEQLRRALPTFSRTNGLLSFCFIDPFDLQLRFETIRRLSNLRIDFLVLLMLGVDGRRNFKRYLLDPSSSRIGNLIDCPEWRQEYKTGGSVVRFVLRKFDQAMQELGYLSAADDIHPITISGMGVLQYVLAFYSKNPMGRHFWRQTRASLSPQLGLEL